MTATTDTIITTPKRGSINIFVLTNKGGGQYFDFSVYIVNQRSNKVIGVVTYSIKNHSNVEHSGDVGRLLHHVNIGQVPEDCILVFAVVGYRRTPLRSFQSQLPAVFIANEDTRTITMVPCALDQASIGESTLSCLATAIVRGSNISYHILSSQINVNNVDTGDMVTVIPSILHAATISKAIFDRPALPASLEQAQAVEAQPRLTVSSGVLPDLPKVVFIEDGIDIKPIPNTEYIHFSTSLIFSKEKLQREPQIVNLPIIFGSAHNVSALALGTCANINVSTTDYVRWLSTRQCIEVHVTSRWLDTVKSSCTMAGNVIFIIHLEESVDEKTLSTLEAKINELGRNALIMAGPMSIVLVQTLTGQKYFYRGVRWEGLLDRVPKYCANVTDLFDEESIKKWCDSKKFTCYPWSERKVVSLDDKRVYFDKKFINISDIFAIFTTLTIEDMIEKNEDIIDIMTQISILLNPEELQKVVIELQKGLLDKITEEINKRKPKFDVMDVLSDPDPKVKRQIEQFYSEKKRLKSQLSIIIDSLGSMTSQRASSSKSQDLKRLVRKSTIQSNVSEVKKMTATDIIALIDRCCEDCLIATIDNEVLSAELQLVQSNELKQMIAIGDILPIATVHPKAGFLDNITTGALLEYSGKAHPLYSETCLAFPYNSDRLDESVIPFPIFQNI